MSTGDTGRQEDEFGWGCCRVAAVVGCVVWALIALMGIGLASDVAARHLPGYPSAGQLRYYVYFPAAMTIIALASVVLLSLRRVSEWIKGAAAIASILIWAVIPFFMLPYTGGV